VNLGVNASYKVTLYETPIGSEVWLFGHWDKDGSGACQGEETLNECDYGGRPVDNEWNRNPIPIILDSEEMTGVDFNCCQFQILPCLE
jgi:hypothetical protein